jgi:two-component system chemotaxis response regulator CheB
MRELYKRLLARSDQVVVVGAAASAAEGREMVLRDQPDVILLDLEMTPIDGITFLKQLMRYRPIPTIVVSAATTGEDAKAIDALRAGALDVIPKMQAADKLVDFGPILINKIIEASHARPQRIEFSTTALDDLQSIKPTPSKLVVAIGASTGGTTAVEYIINNLNRDTPAVVVAIHLPARFTGQFARRLDALLPVKVKEAEQDDVLNKGVVYITPGNCHITLRKLRGRYMVDLSPRTEKDHFCPNIDYLFNSVAKNVGERALGIILTGMGDNGASGLLKMREAGAMTMAEAESSAVVPGMPKAAVALGAVWQVLPLEKMRGAIIDFCRINQPDEDEVDY